MKCVNCRCIIPETSVRCIYCGHAVYRGSAATTPVTRRVTIPYSSSPVRETYDRRYENRYDGTYYTGTQASYVDAAYVNPAYYNYAYAGGYQQYTEERSARKERRSRSDEWDFSVYHQDGSLDLVKLLLYFASLDMLLILLLLLFALVLML